MVTTPELNVPQELLDQLVNGPMTQGDLESMFRSLKKAVIERAMDAEMSENLGCGHEESKPEGQAPSTSTAPSTHGASPSGRRKS